MRRVVAYCNYETRRWTGLAQSCVGEGAGDIVSSADSPAPMVVCDRLERGRIAFALEAADHKRHRSLNLTALWTPTLRTVERLGLLGGFQSPL
jgi:hypothetical protein